MRLFSGAISVIIAVSVLTIINIYTARSVYRWLLLIFPGVNLIAFISVYVLLTATLIIGFMPLPSVIRNTAGWINAYWMGIFTYLLVFFLASDIIVLLGRLVRLIPGPPSPDVMFFKGVAAILLTIGFACYGFFNANQIRFVYYELALEKTAPSDELRLVLISDLHLGSINAERNLAQIVERINILEPDAVFIAGDIFNDAISTLTTPVRVMDLLRSIDAVYGVYASMGNHDGGSKFGAIAEFLDQSGIKLLNDECVTVDGRFVIAGRVDRSPIGGLDGIRRGEAADFLPAQTGDIPIIVMDHNPARIDEYGGEVDLIVAGHTHGGQMFPMNLITNAMYTVHYGHYQKDAASPHVIVTSGASTWGPPMRVGTNNEIVCITLS